MLSENFLTSGSILQTPKALYLAEGPFQKNKHPHPKQPCLYLSDFFSRKKYFLWNKTIKAFDKKKLLQFLSIHEEKHSKPPFITPPFDLFQKQFNDFKYSKNLKKVVPVLFTKSFFWLSPRKLAFLIKNLLNCSYGFVYGYWNEREGFLGLTPEYLFNKTKDFTFTMALAGTKKSSNVHLKKDEKEINEHQIVVQGIIERWRGFLHRKSYMYEDYYGPLKHLRTNIILQNTSQIDFLSTVQKLHPTAALGGYPREEALRWLQKYDKENREYFGSPFGINFPNGDGFCLTAIRNIQWTLSLIKLGSGCGLTQKSQLKKEWQELHLKRQWLKNIMWEA